MNCFVRNKPYGFADHRVEGQSAAPSVLHVCRESRIQAQKHYEVFDDSNRWTPRQAEDVDGTSLTSRESPETLRPLYINFETDRFVQPNLLTSIPNYIPFRYPIAYNFGPDVCQNIRHLQLETSFDAHQNPFGKVSIKTIRFLLVEMTRLSDITLVVRQTFVPTPRDLMKGRSVEFFSVQLSFQEKENSVLEDLRKALNSAGVPPDNLEGTTLRSRFVPSYDEDLVPVSEDGAKIAVQNDVKRSQSLRSLASHSRAIEPQGRCRSG
ncbi:hypothetical protein IFR04_001464 [Cadophora malorum]|uniref:Uncharacterized protein n=1 Tax=Cadophora malorum TaxID=108018 RepID=A0A8H7WIC7_9HELO|nr:hypothetical protein IFR04_001464 [Cadophora malorum]